MAMTIGLNKWQQKLDQLFFSPVQAMGYEYVGCECFSQGQRSIVRAYIDKSDGGVSADDCGKVSHQLSAILEVENLFSHQYTLEVSSPGIERLLFTAEQFKQFIDHQVLLRLHRLLAGKRKLTGMLQGVVDEEVVLKVDDQLIKVPFALIAKAHLTVKF